MVANLTKHHMVPKSCGGRETVPICRTCHRQLHVLFTNKELVVDFNNIDNLKAHPEMRKYLKWVSTKNPDRYFMGKDKKKKR